jgi:hypothetical protein
MAKKKSLAAGVGAVAGMAAGRAVDLALIGGGLATAAGAVGFAGYMVMTGGRAPLVNGTEYLAIFGQPSHPHVGDGAPNPADIDMNPLGAISSDGKDRVGGYQMVGAQEHFAWLREGDRIFAVRPGDEVARLGRIAGIEKREGRWALVDDKGGTLIVSALAEVVPSASGKFDKQMIFGRGN